MNILISGGAKNGKSHYGQEMAKNMAEEKSLPLYYLATMIPHDDEDDRRIARHLRERDGQGFETIEQGFDILESLEGVTLTGKRVDPNGVFLLDATTSLLANEMFRPDGSFDITAGERLKDELTEFARRTGNTVFVSDYIYGDLGNYDSMTEAYRKALAGIERALASVCERVVEVSFGNIIDYK